VNRFAFPFTAAADLETLRTAVPAGNSIYQRKLGRRAKEKKEFGLLVERLKNLAAEQGYTKKRIASELGVSSVAVSQWLSGYTLTGKQDTVAKLRKYLAEERSG
jgi:hypothetical protein